MRIAYFDSGLHLDDPNLRWGDPSYLLEPGDAGYVADPTSASFPLTQTKKHKKTMAKNDYIKNKELEFAAQLTTFKNQIGGYATVLGLSAGQVSAQAADCDRYNYELTVASAYSNKAEEWTKWRRFTRYGGLAPLAGVPVEPTLPGTVPPAVAAGVEERFRATVRLVKASPNYNSAMGEALGIEGEVETAPDIGDVKPVLKLSSSGAGILVGWDFGGKGKFLDSIEIHVERGAGTGFTLLTIDTTPNYLDTAALPGALSKWSYKGIYRNGDVRIGQWCDATSIAVGP